MATGLKRKAPILLTFLWDAMFSDCFRMFPDKHLPRQWMKTEYQGVGFRMFPDKHSPRQLMKTQYIPGSR